MRRPRCRSLAIAIVLTERWRSPASSARSRVHAASDAQSGADLSGHVWRHRGAENECARVIDEMFAKRCAAADERAGAGQSFAAGVRDGDDFAAVVPDDGGDAAAVGAVDADGVGFVQDQAGIVSRAESGQLSDIGDVAVHAEDGFGDDEFAAAEARSVCGARSPDR